MRLAKPIALLTSCVVLYGASFLNPNRENPNWAGAGAAAANLGEMASARPATRPQAPPQGQSARAIWADPAAPVAPARAASIEPPAPAPAIVPAPTPRSEPAPKGDRCPAAKPSKRCGERSCLEPRRLAA